MNNELKETFPRMTAALQIRALGGEGILTEDDLPKLKSQKRNVWDLMCDGRWHKAPQILMAAGGTEGLRRMRELRALPGVDVERCRMKHSRTWNYRLTITQPRGQLELV
jgi:hypothetical protein